MSDFPNVADSLAPQGMTGVRSSSTIIAESGWSFSYATGLWNGDGTWPVANKALLVPVTLEEITKLQRAWWVNASAVAGTLDVGIYDWSGANKLGSTGSITQTGTNQIQTAPLTASITLNPGVYWYAFVMSSVSAHVFGTTFASTSFLRICGIQEMASAGPPLPASLTFANPASAFFFSFGISQQSVI